MSYESQKDDGIDLSDYQDLHNSLANSSVANPSLPENISKEFSPTFSGTKKEINLEVTDIKTKQEADKILRKQDGKAKKFLAKSFKILKQNNLEKNEKQNFTSEFENKYFGKVIYSSFLKKTKKNWKLETRLIFSMKGTPFNRETEPRIVNEETSYAFISPIVLSVRIYAEA